MGKLGLLLLLLTSGILSSCSKPGGEKSQSDGKEINLNFNRYIVVNEQAYSIRKNSILYKGEVVFRAPRPILSCETDTLSGYLALLCSGELLLVQPNGWQITDRQNVTGGALKVKARMGTALLLSQEHTTRLSAFQIQAGKLVPMGAIERPEIRDFAINSSHIGILSSDSIILADYALHPVFSKGISNGQLLAMNDHLLFAKHTGTVWQYSIQNAQLNEGTPTH